MNECLPRERIRMYANRTTKVIKIWHSKREIKKKKRRNKGTEQKRQGN